MEEGQGRMLPALPEKEGVLCSEKVDSRQGSGPSPPSWEPCAGTLEHPTSPEVQGVQGSSNKPEDVCSIPGAHIKGNERNDCHICHSLC